MTTNNGSNFQFGAFVLDTRQNLLLRGTEAVKLPPKAFELLLFFAKNPNQVIDKETLMGEVWSDSIVEEANLAVHISNLRKILNGDVNGGCAIETFPKIGYRFNAEVTFLSNGSTSPTTSISESKNGFEESEIAENSRSDEVKQIGTDRLNPAVTPRNTIRFRIAALTIFGGILLIGGYFLYRTISVKGPGRPTLLLVRGTEHSFSTVISPDGEFFAHATQKDGRVALMMTNVRSNSSVQLLPPEDVNYGGMKFSRDSGFLFFVTKVANVPVLFKIPILGKEPVKVLDNVGYAFSFSPDGERICFVRQVSENETAIVIANADGTDQHIVATRKAPGNFLEAAISWSPIGNLIAVAAKDIKGEGKIMVIGVDVETGAEKILSNTSWTACRGLEWMDDGTGIVAGLIDNDGSPSQIWLIPIPLGEPRKITDDLNNYASISATRDGETIFAVQYSDESSLWITPNGQPARSRPIDAGKHHVFKWVRWTSEGRLLFGSSLSEHRDVWVMNRDGSGLNQLTADASANVMPTATEDGRYIVFSSTRDGDGAYHLWRADADGRDPVRLTSGIEEMQPDMTPDGRWVFFTKGKLNGPLEEKSIWKVSIDGGEPSRFLERPAKSPDVSPDGTLVLCWYKPDDATPWKATIFPLIGGKPVRMLDIPPGTPIHWKMDGTGVSYLRTVDGISNVWTLPLDGGPAIQETQYTSEDIFDFDWSNDGLLVSSRIFRARDVISIRNFR